MSSQVDVDTRDVIRIILQYLKENNLSTSFTSLQQETGISLNMVDNKDVFLADIQYGRWDRVLSQIQNMNITREKLIDLYEQIIIELSESNEKAVAKELLRSTDVMKCMQQSDLERYLKLEHLLKSTNTTLNLRMYTDSSITKERRRAQIADAISQELFHVAPQRLLSLLAQAMKYQSSQGLLPHGSSFDLFRGDKKQSIHENVDKLIQKSAGMIQFSIESHPESIIFAPDGVSLITGSVDGFIEVWDFENCKLRMDLEYQAKEELMMHEEPVLCACFGQSGELLATGSQGGKVKVWKLSSGMCLRNFSQAHTQGVTSVSFSKDGTQILTSSFDCTARIHGLKSGKTIKEFSGHTSYVNCAAYTHDGSKVISGSSDSTCRVWDVKTTECLNTYRFSLIFPRLHFSLMLSQSWFRLRCGSRFHCE